MTAAFAKNTRLNYEVGMTSFRSFRASMHYSDVWPVPLNHIVEFVAYLSIKGYSYRTVNCRLSAISCFHKIQNYPDATQNFIVRKMLDGIRRTRRSEDTRYPISLELLKRLLESLKHVCHSIYETVLFSFAFSMAFFGLLRVSEFTVVNTSDNVLMYGDIQYNSNSINIQLHMSKTDQLGLGSGIRITKDSENKFLFDYCTQYFQSRPKIKGPAFCHFNTNPLTSYQFNAVMKKSLTFIGCNPKHYSSHSFRIGGATALYLKGKTEEEIKAFGRWKSDAWKSYVRI